MSSINTLEDFIRQSFEQQNDPKDFAIFNTIFRRELSEIDADLKIDAFENRHLPLDEDDIVEDEEIYTVEMAIKNGVSSAFAGYQWAISVGHIEEFALLYSQEYSSFYPGNPACDRSVQDTYLTLRNDSPDAARQDVYYYFLKQGRTEQFAQRCAQYLVEEAFEPPLKSAEEATIKHFKTLDRAKELKLNPTQTEIFLERKRYENEPEKFTVDYIKFYEMALAEGKDQCEAEAYAEEEADMEMYMDRDTTTPPKKQNLSQTDQYWEDMDENDRAGWIDNMNKE